MSNSFNTLDADTLLEMAMPGDANISQGNTTDQMLEDAVQKAKIDSVDIYTGAPANVRMSVGAAQTDDDKFPRPNLAAPCLGSKISTGCASG